MSVGLQIKEKQGGGDDTVRLFLHSHAQKLAILSQIEGKNISKPV